MSMYYSFLLFFGEEGTQNSIGIKRRASIYLTNCVSVLSIDIIDIPKIFNDFYQQ